MMLAYTLTDFFYYAALCVAGFSTETSAEITQLALPEKLLPAQDEVLQ